MPKDSKAEHKYDSWSMLGAGTYARVVEYDDRSPDFTAPEPVATWPSCALKADWDASRDKDGDGKLDDTDGDGVPDVPDRATWNTGQPDLSVYADIQIVVADNASGLVYVCGSGLPSYDMGPWYSM